MTHESSDTQVSYYIIQGLNFLFFLLSLGILVRGVMVASEMENFDEVINRGAIITTTVASAIMLLLSLLGLGALHLKNKPLIMISLVGTILLTLVVTLCGILLLVFSAQINGAENIEVKNASETFGARLVDFSLATYRVCCFNVYSSAIEEPEACSATSAELCVSDGERYDSFSSNIPAGLCRLLSNIKPEGSRGPIVGDASVNYGCGENDPSIFTIQVIDYIYENILVIGMVLMVIAFIMFMDLGLTIHFVSLLGKSSTENVVTNPQDVNESGTVNRQSVKYSGLSLSDGQIGNNSGFRLSDGRSVKNSGLRLSEGEIGNNSGVRVSGLLIVNETTIIVETSDRTRNSSNENSLRGLRTKSL